jgi:hypothetical protein
VLRLADAGARGCDWMGLPIIATVARLLCRELTLQDEFLRVENRVWTLSGLKTAYVLFALHLATRRVVVAEATFAPDSRWMGQMARNLLMACEDALGFSSDRACC